MKKYLTKLMFQVQVEEGKMVSQFDEQIRIVESMDCEQAFHKARRIGIKEEEVFYDSTKNRVNWKFIDVMSLYPIDQINDGEQVYSNTHEVLDENSFIAYVRQKSIEIQVKNLTFA